MCAKQALQPPRARQNNLGRLTLKNNHFEAEKKKTEEVIAGMICHFQRGLVLLRVSTGDAGPELVVS